MIQERKYEGNSFLGNGYEGVVSGDEETKENPVVPKEENPVIQKKGDWGIPLFISLLILILLSKKSRL